MSMLQKIKSHFATNNYQLAGYLGISTEQMRSVSCGRRDWSFDSFAEATELFNALETERPLDVLVHVQNQLETEERNARAELKTKAEKLERTLVTKQTRLKVIEKNRANWLRGLHACQSLLAQHKSAEKQQWLERRHRQLLGRLEESNHLKIHLLHAEITGLEARLECLRNSLM